MAVVPILLISRVDLADFDEWAGPLPPSLSHVKLSVSSVLVAGGVCPPCPCHHSILPLPVPVSPGSFCITTTDLSLELPSQVLEGTSPTWTGEGNGSPLQCSCLENHRDRGAWWAAVYGVAQSRTRLKRLSSSNSSIYDNDVNSEAYPRWLPRGPVHGTILLISLRT